MEGKRIYRKDLPDLCMKKKKDPETGPYEQEIFAFIQDFLSPGKTIRLRTSGSTGTPRKLVVRKERMITSARMTGDFLGLKAGDKSLLALPVTYIAGKMMIVRALVLGLDLWFTRPSSTPEIDQDYDFSALTPMQVTQLLQTGNRDKLTRIKTLLIGGGPLPHSLESRLRSLPNRIFHSYGMTETLSHIAMRRINDPGSTGWFSPLPDIFLLSGRQQNLVIYAPGIVGKKALVTHDVVEFSGKDNRLFKILGRTDYIINSGGIKILPEEIERKLESRIPFPFFIGSIPDDILGEKITLFTESGKLSPKERADIRQAVLSITDPHRRPRTAMAVYPFLYTESGKIKRKETIQKALQSGSLYDL